MTIAWNLFTPWSALAGGVLIGVAAAMFVLLNGRIAGISGVLGGLLRPAAGDVAWRIAFVAGLRTTATTAASPPDRRRTRCARPRRPRPAAAGRRARR